MSKIQVVITGPSGVGKTTLSHKIALMLEAEGVTVQIFDDATPISGGVQVKADSTYTGVNLHRAVCITNMETQ